MGNPRNVADGEEWGVSYTRKTCSRCSRGKPIQEFYRRKSKSTGLWFPVMPCKTCHIRMDKERNAAGAAERKAKRKEKLTVEWNGKMVSPRAWVVRKLCQNRAHAKIGKYVGCTATADEIVKRWTETCEACGVFVGISINLEHCHATGKFRGFVCRNCNTILGHAADNPELLRILASYLEKEGDMPRRAHPLRVPRKETPLNEKQERFALQYVIDFDRLRAYRAAGYKTDNKEAAMAAAGKLLKNPRVNAIVVTEKARIAEKLGMTAENTLSHFQLVYLEAMKRQDFSVAVSALDKIAKHYGFYAVHNEQKRKYTQDDVDRLKKELEQAGMDFTRVNFTKPSEN